MEKRKTIKVLECFGCRGCVLVFDHVTAIHLNKKERSLFSRMIEQTIRMRKRETRRS